MNYDRYLGECFLEQGLKMSLCYFMPIEKRMKTPRKEIQKALIELENWRGKDDQPCVGKN